MQIVAILSRYRCPLQVGVLVQIPVLPSVGTAEYVIIELFQPISSHIVICRKSDYVTGKPPVRILTLIFRFKPYPAQTHTRFRIRDHFLIGTHLLIFHTFCHHIIGRVRMLCYIISHFGRIDPETLTQSFQYRLDVFFLIHQNFRVENDIVYFIADSEDRAIRVHYISTLKRYCRRIVFLLRQYLLLILFSTVSRDQIQLRTESCKDKHQRQKKHHQLSLHLDRKSVTGISSSSSIAQIITCLFYIETDPFPWHDPLQTQKSAALSQTANNIYYESL